MKNGKLHRHKSLYPLTGSSPSLRFSLEAHEESCGLQGEAAVC